MRMSVESARSWTEPSTDEPDEGKFDPGAEAKRTDMNSELSIDAMVVFYCFE
jgi:hypothetical protein